MLCPPPYGMKGDATMKRLLAEGAIGAPHEVVLHSMNGGWLDAAAPAHWRQRAEISGLQVLTFGIYVEVIQRWLGDIVAVQADGRVVHENRQGYTVEIPDFMHVLCSFRNGARGSFVFSGVASHPPRDGVEIYGSGRHADLRFHQRRNPARQTRRRNANHRHPRRRGEGVDGGARFHQRRA